jgi:hypothetical protein
MDKRVLKELLAAHADQLLNGKATGKDYLELLPGRDEELGSLMDVAERVRSTLRPITPANNFEKDLKQKLLQEAQRRQREGYNPPHPFRDLFYLLAGVAFILSLAMVLVTLKRRGLVRPI